MLGKLMLFSTNVIFQATDVDAIKQVFNFAALKTLYKNEHIDLTFLMNSIEFPMKILKIIFHTSDMS